MMARILLVEDEALFAFATELELTQCGHEVIGIADNGQDAVRMARDEQPDIILMDIVLKGTMNGIEATEEINRSTGCRIIYVTGHSDKATLNLANGTAHSGILFKPVEPGRLRECIDHAYGSM